MSKLFLPLLLLCCFCISSCNQFSKNPSETPQYSFQYEADLANASGSIIHTKEFDDCLTPLLHTCIKQSVNVLAINEKNMQICQQLQNDDEKNACQFGVGISLSSEKKESAPCDALEDASYQRKCKVAFYNREALEKKDIHACDTLGQLFSGSTSQEEKDEGIQAKDQCLLDVILATKNITKQSCELLSSDDEKQQCILMISLNEEIKERDALIQS